MKFKIMIVTLLLAIAAQVSARDLAQMKNFRELSNLDYSKLPAHEQEQLLRLAVSSNLQPQLDAARLAVKKHFPRINWKELENVYRQQGFNGVKVKLGLTGAPAAPATAAPVTTTPVVKTPAIIHIEKQQEQIQKEITKVEHDVVKQEQIVEQKQHEKEQLLQKEQQQKEKSDALIKQKEAEGKQAEAEALKKKQEEDNRKAALEVAKKEAEAEKASQELTKTQEEAARLKAEEEEKARELAAINQKAQNDIKELMGKFEVNKQIAYGSAPGVTKDFLMGTKDRLQENRGEAHLIIPDGHEKTNLLTEIDNAIKALDKKLEAMQKEEASRKDAEKKAAEQQKQKEAEQQAEQQAKKTAETKSAEQETPEKLTIHAYEHQDNPGTVFGIGKGKYFSSRSYESVDVVKDKNAPHKVTKIIFEKQVVPLLPINYSNKLDEKDWVAAQIYANKVHTEEAVRELIQNTESKLGDFGLKEENEFTQHDKDMRKYLRDFLKPALEAKLKLLHAK